MKRISDSNQRKVGIILSYGEMFVSVVIGILYTPLMIRSLGSSEYGLYGTISSVIGLIALIDMGFSSSYIKFYSKYKSKDRQDKINSFNALFFSTFLVLALVFLIIGMFLAFNLQFVFKDGLTTEEYGKARIMMILMTFTSAFGFANTVFTSFISANQKFIFLKSVSLISSIVSVSINVVLLLNHCGVISLIILSVILTVLTRLIYLYVSFKELKIKFDFKHIEKGLFRQVFAFSGLIAINLIVDKVNQGIDSLLLARFCGTAVVAVYNVGASINSHYTSFSTAISGVFVPRVHELVNAYEMDSKEQRKVLTDFFVKVGRLQFLLLALIGSGFIFFGKAFIRYWAGDGYDDAYAIALVMLIPSIIPLTQNVGIEIQRAENRHHYRSYIYGAMAIVNLVMSYFLCQIWGGLGSAIGTGFACIVANITIMNIVYHKKINIDVWQYWKNIGRILLGLIVPFAVGTAIMKFVEMNSLIKLFGFIIVYTVVYCIFAYFFSVNNFEKSLIHGAVRKVLRKK